MPNEMPAQMRWQQRDLGARFLDFAFTKYELSASYGFADFFGIMRFRNGDQLNFLRAPPGRVRGLFYFAPHFFEPFRSFTHRRRAFLLPHILPLKQIPVDQPRKRTLQTLFSVFFFAARD